MGDFFSGLFGGGSADMTPSSSGEDAASAAGSGDTGGLLGAFKSMSPDLPGNGMDMQKLQMLMKDPAFMAALQMMMAKPKVGAQATSPLASIGGLGGLGGM